MPELAVFAYCAAVGFVAAATLSSFYELVTSRRADFSLPGGGLSKIAVVLVMSMFAGPFIVIQKLIAGLSSREISIIPAAFGAIIVGMWSVCAGVFYVSLLIAAG